MVFMMGSPFFARGYPALTASASPNSVSKNRTGPGGVTSETVAVTVGGGAGGGVTAAWSASISGVTFSNAGSLSTTISRDLANGESVSFTATCTVTDTITGQTAQAQVSVNFTSTFLGDISFVGGISFSGAASGSGEYGIVARNTIGTPLTWAIEEDTPGLSWSGNGGSLSYPGTTSGEQLDVDYTRPSVPGTYYFIVSVTDGAGRSGSTEFSSEVT